MATSDGRWHVEALRRGDACWYRLTHDDNTIDWLELADVERVLDQAGVALSTHPDVNTAA